MSYLNYIIKHCMTLQYWQWTITEVKNNRELILTTGGILLIYNPLCNIQKVFSISLVVPPLVLKYVCCEFIRYEILFTGTLLSQRLSNKMDVYWMDVNIRVETLYQWLFMYIIRCLIDVMIYQCAIICEVTITMSDMWRSVRWHNHMLHSMYSIC